MINLATQNDRQATGEKCDSVGFVFPVYFWDVPDFVRDLIRLVKVEGNPYVFAVVTCGGGPGKTLSTLDGLLKEKGLSLAAGFDLVMPDNAYLKINLVTPPEERTPFLDAAETRLADIAGVIRRKERPGITTKKSLVFGPVSLIMKSMATKVYRMQRRYRADERCNGCGSCQRICPTGNIRVDGKKVTWGDNCAQCQACFHWCPQKAVQLDKKTPKIARYHHPQIALKDMLLR